jgi:hypothetical protein
VVSSLGLEGELVGDALLYRAGMDTNLADSSVERLVEVLLTINGELNQTLQEKILALN